MKKTFIVILVVLALFSASRVLAVWNSVRGEQDRYSFGQPRKSRRLAKPEQAKSADQGHVVKERAEGHLFFYTHSSVSSYSGAEGAVEYMPDGTYSGSFAGYNSATVTVEVEILDGKAVDIRIVDSREDEYVDKARGILVDVLEAQSVEVDTVTGATITSKAILGAIDDAMSRGPVRGAKEE